MESVAFALSTVIGVGNDVYLRKKYGFRYACSAFILFFCCYLMVRVFRDPLQIMKGIFFAEIMILISYQDVATHEISDGYLIPLFLIGLYPFHPLQSCLGLLLVSIPFYIVSRVIKHFTGISGFGGGDIALSAAAGFVLGPELGVAGVMISLALILFYNVIILRLKQGFYAMAPWLCAGCLAAYLLS